jgi:ParB family transcriptional regulator, chromosome partitioning protein
LARREPSRVRGVLGERARDALFDLAADAPRLVEIDTEAVRPNPAQPRRRVDEAGLAELAASIERHGLLQPIVVKEEDGGYVLVAGQRRLLAHRHLGRERVAALIVAGEPDELALIENLQRQDLPPLDEAEALAALKARHGYSQDELARIMAKAKSTISELLSLVDLPEPVKAEVRTSEPPVAKSVLVEVARAGDPEAQRTLWERLRGGGTVRAARAAKQKIRTSEPAVLATGRRLLDQLDRLERGTVGETPALPELLAVLRDRIDSLLG